MSPIAPLRKAKFDTLTPMLDDSSLETRQLDRLLLRDSLAWTAGAANAVGRSGINLSQIPPSDQWIRTYAVEQTTA